GLVAAGQMAKRSADGLLGGHFASHDSFKNQARLFAQLTPVRVPVVVHEDAAGNRLPLPNKPWGWAAVEGVNNLASHGLGLEAGDPLTNPLAQSYAAAVWNSAPDAAAGYARWVLLSRVSHLSVATGRARFGLDPREATLQNQLTSGVWRGGNGLKTALGIDSGEEVHWPEALSLFSPTDSFKMVQLIDFCRATGRFKPAVLLQASGSLADSFRHDLARVILFDLSEDLSATWQLLFKPQSGDIQAITPAMSAFHKRAEAYLAERPPWPPASVTDLTKRRGFEYVVALIEQIAADGDQRDWLIREFQKEPQPLDPALLDESLGGGLLKNVRFRAWLRAEWRAWVAQRCRRTRRLFQQGDFETMPG
ncbi:MAG: hypothetical protein ACKO85_04890, partial [Isosphaeraceae bacterium]